ncbi:MAG TPA: glycosyltransferase, partial [Thermoplasmatales archaeon]|nr:glycosyltransferase [Thermoplasmatales archaeon]
VVDDIKEKNKILSLAGEKTIIEISKKYEECSGKNSALLTGIEKAKGEIFVFADDDISPHPKWLKYLVSSLDNASTTYRWYFRSPFLCVWNASVASVLFYKRFNFAWGGSTAIRKEVFENLI